VQRIVPATEEQWVAKKVALMGGSTSILAVRAVARVFLAVMEIKTSANSLGIVTMAGPVPVKDLANANTIGLEITAIIGQQEYQFPILMVPVIVFLPPSPLARSVPCIMILDLH